MTIASNQRAKASDALGLRQMITVQYLNGDIIPSFTSDVIAYAAGQTTLRIHIPGSAVQERDTIADWSLADIINSVVIEGIYVYVYLRDNGTNACRVYRYSKTNIAAGGTLMTISGQAFGTTGTNQGVVSDGAGTFYFTCKGNNSASQHIVSKYTLSGTTLTYVSDVTCGSTSANFDFIQAVVSGSIYGMNGSDAKRRKYNSAGTLQATSPSLTTGYSMKIQGNFYNCSSPGNTIRLYALVDLE